jgi:hypothetical protein
MKKLTLICGLFVSAIVLITSCSKSSNEREIASAPDFIPFQTEEDGDFGLLGKDGKVLFTEEFADEINPAFAGMFVKEKEGNFSLYKAEQKPVVLKGYEELFDAGAMQEGLIPITKKNERVSFIDKEGKVQFTLNPHNGKEIIQVGYFSNGLAWVLLEDGKCGFIDKKGKVVIEPKYTHVINFQDGIAFVVEEKGEVLMINKAGKVVKKLKDLIPFAIEFAGEKNPIPIYTSQWIDGKMICIDEETENCVSINKKGEIIKKYPKNLLIVDCIGDNYVYLDDKEGRWGVNNSKYEVVIRPKYERLQAINENLYLAEKSNKEIVIIDQNGEVVKQLDDYKSAVYYNGVIYAKVAHNKYELLDTEGKLLSQEEFIIDDLEKLWTPCSWICRSDYFNSEELAKQIAASINDKGMGNLVIGSAFNIGKPEDYSNYLYYADIKDFSQAGVNANILSHKGFLELKAYTADIEKNVSETVVKSQYDETVGKSIKSFNPKAQIAQIDFYAHIHGNESAKENLQKAIEISKTLVAELKTKGWKTHVESKYNYCLTKGDLYIEINPHNGLCYFVIGYKNVLNDENAIKTNFEYKDNYVEESLAEK